MLHQRIFILTAAALLILLSKAPAQSPVHLGFSVNWDYGISMPENSQFTPYASGQISALSFDFHLGIPFGIFRLTPTFSTSIPLRTLLLHNTQGSYVPGGYTLSVPYSSGSDFSYYQYSDTYESDQSQAEIYQNLYGSFLTLNFGDSQNDVQLGSGLFLRKKKAIIYTPLLYDEYEWYSSTGTEWNNYFYSYTYSEPETQITTLRENSVAIPLLIDFCHHFGTVYSGASFVYYLNPDPWMSFRYSMGVNF